MGLISVLLENPLLFVLLVIPLLYSVIMHEVAHGLVALFFGDRTAKEAGRLTLNPLPHLSLYGSLALFFVGFGWAKPVPVRFDTLKPRRLGVICVALAGCATNFVLASLSISALKMDMVKSSPALTLMLSIMVSINLVLGAFNLIPIPPLDGSKVLMGLLPVSLERKFARLEPYGFVILILLIMTGVLRPWLEWMHNLFYRWLP